MSWLFLAYTPSQLPSNREHRIAAALNFMTVYAHLEAVGVAVESIGDGEVGGAGFQAAQVLVCVVEGGHVKGEPAAGLRPVAQLVSDHILRVEILVAQEGYRGGDDQQVSFEA